MIKRITNRDKEDSKNLTLVGHLTELRRRIIHTGIFFIIATLVCYYYSESIVRDIINRAPNINFVFIAPAELLLSYIKLAVVGGLALSLPFIIFQIWSFISPGLKPNERKTIIVALTIGSIFFFLGVIFAYIVVMPFMIQFFIGFQIDEIRAMISFSNYLGFVIDTLLAFGLIFELPVIMIILTRFNIVTVRFFKKNRKYIILIIFIIAAIITPPDVISQILIALPMLVLFEIGIFFSTVVEKKKD